VSNTTGISVFVVTILPPHNATIDIYSLSLHDALPILSSASNSMSLRIYPLANRRLILNRIPSISFSSQGTSLSMTKPGLRKSSRSEEHTSELQSRENLVCRLLLEKKKK